MMESLIINAFLWLVKGTILYVIIYDAVKNGIISAQKYLQSGQGDMQSEASQKQKSGKD